jgi:hypothetical protein
LPASDNYYRDYDYLPLCLLQVQPWHAWNTGSLFSPQQFPMAPGILFICTMLFHNWFMDFWPGKKLIGNKDVMLDDNGDEITK